MHVKRMPLETSTTWVCQSYIRNFILQRNYLSIYLAALWMDDLTEILDGKEIQTCALCATE